jgi:hypothetical protein
MFSNLKNERIPISATSLINEEVCKEKLHEDKEKNIFPDEKAPSDTPRRVSSHRRRLLYLRRNISSLKLSGSSSGKLQEKLFILH